MAWNFLPLFICAKDGQRMGSFVVSCSANCAGIESVRGLEVEGRQTFGAAVDELGAVAEEVLGDVGEFLECFGHFKVVWGFALEVREV